MVRLQRTFRHLCAGQRLVSRYFLPENLAEIESSVRSAEQRHGGEIRVCIEAALDGADLWRNITARQRAEEVFSRLRVWDTEYNNGVLLYFLLADRDVEILADRALSRVTQPRQWEAICQGIERHFRAGEYMRGVREGIEEISSILERHFPKRTGVSELSDRPEIL